MNLVALANRFFYKLNHISEFPRGNLTGCLLNMARRGLAPTRLIDVGANRGRWSRDARVVFPDCRCLLVEPQIEMQPHLDRFCRRNPGCTWVCAGAGEALGELPLTIKPDSTGSNFVCSEQTAIEQGLVRRVVPITTLDRLCEDHFSGAAPEIVKIDAEGFESQVLRGASSLLGRTEVFFLEAQFLGMENTSSIVPLTVAMDQYGYVPYDFTWFGKRPYDGAIGLCEIAYVRKAGVLRSFLGWRAQGKKAA